MIHIYPINDVKPHDLTITGSKCECEPTVYWENLEMIVSHNSFDGREAVEEANKILNPPSV